MKIKDLSFVEFDEFSKKHPLGNYYQTSYYALLARSQGFEYDILGLVDEEDNLHAAALIIIKKIGLFYSYGYSPKGFLIDYFDTKLLKTFLDKVKEHYNKQNMVFIKFNPEISIGTIDYKNKEIKYNKNKMIENTIIGLNIKKLEGSKRFETQFPTYNAIQVLKRTNLKSLSKNTRNKINKTKHLGMTLKRANKEDIKSIYELIKKKTNHSLNFYYKYYESFSKNNSIDLFLVEINFEECLLSLREKYEKESETNEKISNILTKNPTKENKRKKKEIEESLKTIGENITIVTNLLAQDKKVYIASAITIKFKNRVSILISGYDKKYSRFCPNYFLHYALINYYKDNYDFIDLNGITADFTDNNPYSGLNKFKLGFNPLTFEYIGEFDFILDKDLYNKLNHSGKLAKEFKRKEY